MNLTVYTAWRYPNELCKLDLQIFFGIPTNQTGLRLNPSGHGLLWWQKSTEETTTAAARWSAGTGSWHRQQGAFLILMKPSGDNLLRFMKLGSKKLRSRTHQLLISLRSRTQQKLSHRSHQCFLACRVLMSFDEFWAAGRSDQSRFDAVLLCFAPSCQDLSRFVKTRRRRRRLIWWFWCDWYTEVIMCLCGHNVVILFMIFCEIGRMTKIDKVLAAQASWSTWFQAWQISCWTCCCLILLIGSWWISSFSFRQDRAGGTFSRFWMSNNRWSLGSLHEEALLISASDFIQFQFNTLQNIL